MSYGCAKRSRSVRQVAITFDDGYADNAGEARRILAAAGLPATFFVTVGTVGRTAVRLGGTGWSRSFWSARPPRAQSKLRSAAVVYGSTSGRPRARERAHLALFWRLRPLCPAAIESILADMESQLGVRSVDRETHRWMTVDELRALSASDRCRYRCAYAHSSVSSQPVRSKSSGRRSMAVDICSNNCWERARACSPIHMAGPTHWIPSPRSWFGKPATHMACTATGGIARADCDPLLIPRNVVGDWDAERFETWLDHWLGQP